MFENAAPVYAAFNVPMPADICDVRVFMPGFAFCASHSCVMKFHSHKVFLIDSIEAIFSLFVVEVILSPPSEFTAVTQLLDREDWIDPFGDWPVGSAPAA